ncbi:Smr/MutS family protein [Rhodospirillum centenum]|uniref:Smr domain protein, putative n=1 Tax=Rhodospirillum centenum (strain ATCC 51521 / SW) TaxID=414684 RepID=B6IVC6_RHOCS|nr:Smr/MutS family protein [Rhodospirillum centenum]ACJ00250.1 Smr domain protein, putative [Rhodospirillum centenum SW]
MARKDRLPTDAERELWRTVVRDARPLKRRLAATTADVGTAPAGSADAEAPDGGTAGAAVNGTRTTEAAATVSPRERLADLLKGGGLPVASRGAVSVSLAPSALGNRGGIDKRTDEKVRRGRLPIDGRIDLHGLTQSEAHDALAGFVRRAHGSGRRLLLVITGKGGPGYGEDGRDRGVLRSAVPRWLNEASLRPLVLAVHHAQPQHGGQGAFYVYLRRRRE